MGATTFPAPDPGQGPQGAPPTAGAFQNATASYAASRCTGLPLAFTPGLWHLSDPNTHHLRGSCTPSGSAQHLPSVRQPLPARLPPPHGWVGNHTQIQGQWESRDLLIVPDKGGGQGPGAGLALIELLGPGPQDGAPLPWPSIQPPVHGSDGDGCDADNMHPALLLRSCGLSALELASGLRTMSSAVLQGFPPCPLGALATRIADSAELETAAAAAAEAAAAGPSTPVAGALPLHTALLGRVTPRRAVSGMAPWPPQDSVPAPLHAPTASATARAIISAAGAGAAALQSPPYDLRVYFQGQASAAGWCGKDGGGDSGHGSQGVGCNGGQGDGHGGEYDGLYGKSDGGLLGRVLTGSPVELLEGVHGLRELRRPGACVVPGVWQGAQWMQQGGMD